MKTAVAFAPASIGNVAVGFDVLGQSLDGAGDRATVHLTNDGQVRITAIRGVITDLPLEASRNTAGRALMGLMSKRPGVGFALELDKGIALGSGMGGSAASAVAALVAANALLKDPVPLDELYELARDGEEVASGSRHGDNVAPSLYGGLMIATEHGAPVRVPVPSGLWCAVVRPHFSLPTREARAVLSDGFPLGDFVMQSEGLALVLAGCFGNDLDLIRRGLRDVLIEPRRSTLIPGFVHVKAAALAEGALGSSISGAGPSVFAWFADRAAAERATKAMANEFAAVNLASDQLVSPVAAGGAKVESCSA